jgi:hypothetical protein
MNEENEAGTESPSGNLGKLALVAGLAINLMAPAVSGIEALKEKQVAAERMIQAWGDCIDE